MTRVRVWTVIVIAILLSFASAGAVLGDEGIYSLRIENINMNGADFYWSTSVETKGSIEYAYAKLAQLYNPQSPGSQQDVLMTVVPLRVKSEPHYVKAHHIRIDNLDMYYAPIVQYRIKSETPSGEVYAISGELVLVDAGVIPWWQTPWFAVGMPIGTLVLGLMAERVVSRIKQRLRPTRLRERDGYGDNEAD